jgi:phosphohistidine phosphatase
MKRLYLIRHAEALNAPAGTEDIKRKLTYTGIQETKKIAKYLMVHKVNFDCIISSHAVRAMETAKLIASIVNYPADKILCDKRIYLEESRVFFDMLQELDNSVSKVAIVGHNPELNAFALHFLNDFSVRMSPSTVIGIEIMSNDWSKIKWAVHKKLFILTPQTP